MRIERLALIVGAACLTTSQAANGQDNPTSSDDAWIEMPKISPGRNITLSESLRAADHRNLSLSAVRLEIEKAEAQLGKAWALVLPTAQGTMQYSHADHEDTVDIGSRMGAPGMGGSMVVRKQDDLKGSVSANISLINVQSWYSISLAKRGAELAELSVRDARQQFLFGVAKSYYMALMSKALVDLRRAQVESAAHHLSVARKKHSAGAGLLLDVIRAETDLTQAQQELINAHLSLDTARDALGVLTGMGELPIPVQPPEKRMPNLNEKEMVERGVQERSDLRVNRANIALASRQLDTTWMALLPTLGLGWQGGYQFTDPSDLGDPDRSRWTAMATLSVPIFSYFSYRDIEEKKVLLNQALLRAEDAELNARKEVRQARRSYLAAISSMTISERQVTMAREGLKLALTAYAAGSGSSLDVTEARRAATVAEVGFVTRQLESRVALLVLLRAIGEDMAAIGTAP
jgi:outer membrane protein